MKTIGCIGIGNMGGALLEAICKTEYESNTLICDFNTERVNSFTSKYKCKSASKIEIADNVDYIILGVKPQNLSELLSSLSSNIFSRYVKPVLISMAAGVTTEKILSVIKCDCPVIRIMPNVAASVGEAAILYDYTSNVTEDMLNDFRSMFEFAGKLLHIKEDKIDAASAISGCGPAFVSMFIEALADGGVSCGLPRSTAMELAIQTIIGTGVLLSDTKMHPGVLKDAVTSPAGTTIAGVRALENSGFRAAVMEAVIAAYERASGLNK